MLHTKFRVNRSTGSREENFKCFFYHIWTINGHGGHLSHVTSIMLINIPFLVPKRIDTKFGYNGPVVS